MHSKRNKRRFKGNRPDTVINADIVNITNVTNVTNMMAMSHGHPSHRQHKLVNNRDGHEERPPKLFRNICSFGVLDRDVAARMSDSELFSESAKVVSYSARGLGRCLKGFGDEVGEFGKSVIDTIAYVLFGGR